MPTRRSHLRHLRHWLANRGLRGVAGEVLYRLRLLLQGKPQPGRGDRETGVHPFDLEYGVDTTGLLWGESLSHIGGHAGKDAKYWATGYYGIAPSVLTNALDRLALDWTRFTFVDIGCGKGRVLLLALRYPFRRVLGVELSPSLAAVAQQNLASFAAPWRQAGLPAEVIAADAAAFPLPSGPLLLFLYHPFAAPVMRRFLVHVREAAKAETRDIYLLYTNPELRSLLDSTPGLTRLWDDWPRLTEAESAADRFGSTQEHTVAYRIQPA